MASSTTTASTDATPVADERTHSEEQVANNASQTGAVNNEGPWENFGVGDHLKKSLPILDTSFALYRGKNGTTRVYGINDRREATLVEDDTALNLALHHGLKAMHNGLIPLASIVSKGISLWQLETTPIHTDPAPFCFKGDDRLCFVRFDWEPSPGEYPAWLEFLNRLSDPLAFMAFVWSAFESRNRSRQFLWLRGDGEDGKSAVFNVLAGVFNNAAVGLSNSHVGKNANQFVNSIFYGKRAAFYSDCKNAKFGMSEIVRNITSGDPVSIEFKNQTPFTCVLYVKLFIASNQPPLTSSETADQSRMIYIEVKPSKNTDDPTWPERLRAELPGFLHACRSTYEKLCPRHGKIEISEQSLALRQNVAQEFEEDFEDFFDEHLQVQQGAEMLAQDLNKVLRVWTTWGRDGHKVGDFKLWLKRTKGISQSRDKRKRFYPNLSMRQRSEVMTDAAPASRIF